MTYLEKNIPGIKPKGIVFALTICILVLQSCYHDKEELLYPGSNTAVDCTTTPSNFSTDIYPMVSSKCAISGCHDVTASGGIMLQNYTQINARTDRINARAIMEKSMPPTGALLPAEINKLKCWLENGALNN